LPKLAQFDRILAICLRNQLRGQNQNHQKKFPFSFPFSLFINFVFLSDLFPLLRFPSTRTVHFPSWERINIHCLQANNKPLFFARFNTWEYRNQDSTWAAEFKDAHFFHPSLDSTPSRHQKYLSLQKMIDVSGSCSWHVLFYMAPIRGAKKTPSFFQLRLQFWLSHFSSTSPNPSISSSPITRLQNLSVVVPLIFRWEFWGNNTSLPHNYSERLFRFYHGGGCQGQVGDVSELGGKCIVVRVYIYTAKSCSLARRYSRAEASTLSSRRTYGSWFSVKENF